MAKSPIAKKIFWGVVIVLGATGLVFAYKKFIAVPSANKLAEDEEAKAKANPTQENIEAARQARITADLSSGIPANTFPIKRGSRGTYVKKLQEWLIKKYGKASTVPRYGADGIFGSETEGALKSHGLETVLTQEKYNEYISTPAASDFLNKKIYARYNDVRVLKSDKKTLVKTVKKDDFVGIASLTAQPLSDDYFLGVSNPFLSSNQNESYVVTQSHVYAK